MINTEVLGERNSNWIFLMDTPVKLYIPMLSSTSI